MVPIASAITTVAEIAATYEYGRPSADGVNKDVLVLANAGRVRQQAFLHFCWDNFPPFFCAENDVHYILEIGVRQGVAPPALIS